MQFSILSSHLPARYIKVKIYKGLIVPIILYECETWSHKLREEHSLRVLENKVLRRMSGPESDEVTGGRNRFYNEELRNFYSVPNSIRMISSRRVSGACNAHGVDGKCVQRFLYKA
jgi:hypothetical protein